MLGAHVGTGATFVGIGIGIGILAVIAFALPAVLVARQSFRRAFRALRNSTLSVGVGLYLLPSVLMGVQNTVAPLRLSDAGWSVSAIGTIFVVAAAIQAAWNPLFGRWLDRVDPRAPIVLALAGSAGLAGLLAVPWLGGHWTLAVLIGAAGIAFVSFYLLGSTLIARARTRPASSTPTASRTGPASSPPCPKRGRRPSRSRPPARPRPPTHRGRTAARSRHPPSHRAPSDPPSGRGVCPR